MGRYLFREGARTPAGVSAEEVHTALEEVRENTGGNMTPAAVVEHATPKSSVLHPFFEWRNSEAAQKYREWQARQVIRVVVVRDDEGKKTSAFAPTVRVVRGQERRVYDSLDVIVQRPDEWLATLSEFTSKINGARRTLEMLERYAGTRDNPDRLARIALAAKSLDAAIAALQ